MNRSRILLALAAVLLTPSCIAGVDDTSEDTATESDAVRRCASGSTTRGVDVSEFQGTIDWSAAKNDGIRFGIARVSDGTSHPDPMFAKNWSRMRAAGVVRGAYQFFRPTGDPIAQAKLLLSKIESAGGLDDDDLPPTIDVEVSDGVSAGTVANRVNKWVDYVEEATGRAPMIYTAPGFWNGIGAPGGFSKNPLWVANWGVSCPDVPGPWGGWKFWQKTDHGRVAGIPGFVDVDVFNGSLSDLEAFAAKWPSSHAGDRVGVSTYGPGRLDVFARSDDNHLIHRYRKDGTWSSWKDLGGNLASAPVAVSWASGRIDVFAKNKDAHLIHKRWSEGAWHAWEDLGGNLTSAPTVSTQGERSLDVFARGKEDHLVYKSFRDGTGWSAWKDLGGDLASTPTAVSWAEGRIDVFARDADDKLLHLHFANDQWSAWKTMKGPIHSGPVVTSWGEGRLDVFAKGAQGELVHRWYTNGAWSEDWEGLGGKLVSPPGAVSWGDGRIDIFARGTDDVLVHKRFASGSGWSSWNHLGDVP
jgi:GH25 family lysozyme M1 (1,4-beta-N-acetylmuramidase)